MIYGRFFVNGGSVLSHNIMQVTYVCVELDRLKSNGVNFINVN